MRQRAGAKRRTNCARFSYSCSARRVCAEGSGTTPACQAKARVEYLRYASALWRVIVKQDDALAHRHRAGRPGNYCFSCEQPLQIKEAQPIRKYRDMAAGNQHRGRP